MSVVSIQNRNGASTTCNRDWLVRDPGSNLLAPAMLIEAVEAIHVQRFRELEKERHQ